MCGISGIIDWSAGSSRGQLCEAMTQSQAHRGPDGDGVISIGNATLGHRRLSIIDLAGGAQPMSTEDGQFHLSYNGEIYNYQELRQELSSLGHNFQTSSDSEVVLKSYQQWGRFCVDRFEGMFAFAVLDLNRREVLLARDHLGIKPLIYRRLPNSVAFASEILALKVLPDWSSEIDLRSIDLFLRYQYIPAPLTAFRNVFKLPAGHRMVVKLDEPKISMERYWQPEFTPKKKRSERDLLFELDHCLRDSVRRHLVSDVPFGAFLSGGIDSSLVTGYMSELLEQPVKTFCIGFDDSKSSELQYARKVAQKYRTEHHEEILTADAFSVIPEVVRHYGEPYGDQSAIATWAVCRLARQHVPMVLSGDGGDEFFAGYASYGGWLERQPAERPQNPLASVKDSARRLRNRLQGRQALPASVPDHLPSWFPMNGRFHEDQLRSQLWKKELRFLADTPAQTFEWAYNEAREYSWINQAQYLDLCTFLPEDILTKVDIASMSVGLEVRPPILDRRVFELAASIPESQLYSTDHGYCGKLPLKRLAEARFGHDFAFRRKQGFEIPVDHWLRGTPNRKQELQQRLTDPQTGLCEWFCPEAIRTVVQCGTAFNTWLLCVLQEWRLQNCTN